MGLVFLVGGEGDGGVPDLSVEHVSNEEVISLGGVVSSLSEEALNLLAGDVVLSLDTDVNVVVGDVGGSLEALDGAASLPGVVEG